MSSFGDARAMPNVADQRNCSLVEQASFLIVAPALRHRTELVECVGLGPAVACLLTDVRALLI